MPSALSPVSAPLQCKVNELRARRAVLEVSPTVMTRLAGRGVSSADKLRERTRATIEIREGSGGNSPAVDISGDPSTVTAAKREVGDLLLLLLPPRSSSVVFVFLRMLLFFR